MRIKAIHRIITAGLTISVLILAFTITVPAAERKIYDYNDFVYDYKYDGDTKTVVLSIPLDDCTYGFREPSTNDWLPGTGSSLRYTYFDFGYYDHINFNFYPLGGSFLDAYNIPPDTKISYKTEISYRVDESSNGCVYGDCKGYATALDSNYDVIRNNISTSERITVNAGTGQYYSETIEVVSSFYKNNNTKYLEPQFAFSFWADDSIAGNVTFDVSVVEITLTMSLNALWEQQQTNGKTNELLEELIDNVEGTPGQNNSALNGVQDKINQMDSFSQPEPDINGALNNINSSDMAFTGSLFVGSGNFYVFLTSLMLTGVSLGLVGYVLHGKK